MSRMQIGEVSETKLEIDGSHVTVREQIKMFGPSPTVTEVVTLLIDKIDQLNRRVEHLEANKILLEDEVD